MREVAILVLLIWPITKAIKALEGFEEIGVVDQKQPSAHHKIHGFGDVACDDINVEGLKAPSNAVIPGQINDQIIEHSTFCILSGH